MSIFVIREYRKDDIAWAVERHGTLYREEYGWNEEFEELVASLFAKFEAGHDPEREKCWIAETDGERMGCVFVVGREGEPDTSQLRCLLVEPTGRGRGIGNALVQKCIDHSRESGYERIVLWTNDVLEDARRLYERFGFRLIAEEAQSRFGKDVVSQTWAMDL